MHAESHSRDLPTLAATEELARAIAAVLRSGDTILLAGPLGAGKTALARALLRCLADDPTLEVPSPSYTLVQEYDMPIGRVSHFDLWRLDGPADLAELGWDEARAGIILVEWPERLGEQRPMDALSIELSHGIGAARRVLLRGWPDRLEQLA